MYGDEHVRENVRECECDCAHESERSFHACVHEHGYRYAGVSDNTHAPEFPPFLSPP